MKKYFIPSAALFAESRLATVHSKQDLQAQLSTLGADQRLQRLPRAASVELKELVMEAVKSNSNASVVWQTILGGINENTSTGLRKWAAKHGRGNEAAIALESVLQRSKGGWVRVSVPQPFVSQFPFHHSHHHSPLLFSNVRGFICVVLATSTPALQMEIWTEDADWAILKPWAEEAVVVLTTQIPRPVQVQPGI